MIGDTVLRQDIRKGAPSNFLPNECIVKDIQGSEITIISKETGAEYKRNRRMVKRLSVEEGLESQNQTTQIETSAPSNIPKPELGEDVIFMTPETGLLHDGEGIPEASRKKRERRMPQWLQQFETY